MKAIVVDDEPIALEVVRAHAAKVPFLELKAAFTDAFAAMDYLQKEPVDLIFLDIKMPDISGIDFYNSLSRKPLLVFTTAYSEHAVTSFEMDAIDYLLKPFSLARFVKACNKAYELYNFRNATEAADHLFVKTGSEQVKVFFDEILYLEATGNYVSFVLKDRKVLSRSTFAEAVNWVPAARFVRIHRSFLVSTTHIQKADRTGVQIGGQLLPVSEAYYKGLLQALQPAGR
ncbi:two component transcriptional regulator, LytTR family [Cnuella takakiae]|uniref:Two component transcriptional regulator, LytTR family n=1 Tax=Cnuella takakiae TaxID=1302690 RepID=A0A1M5DUD5_9BACT|nr:LytTR family DNA-binding domain-containing protein [Cnuella takakiae]OLY93864.1 DNA-binding response regulator [Cnuella takakiae]SHF70540.1 two component transcriptional regulator, LytTR family [Cnuella takakiae]